MSAFSWEQCLVVFLILAASGLIQGMLGFGFGIVAMSLLPLTLGLRDGVTLIAVLFAGLMPISLYWQKRAFNWRDARPLTYGTLLGVPIGALLVGTLPLGLLYQILGIIMAVIGAAHFLNRRRASRPPSARWEWPIGVLSGLLTGGFNMGGPPLVAYAYASRWTGEQAKAVLTTVFLISGTMRLFFIGLTSVNLPKVLLLSAILVIPTAVVLRAGIALGRKIPHTSLRPVVFAYLGLVGLYYVFVHH